MLNTKVETIIQSIPVKHTYDVFVKKYSYAGLFLVLVLLFDLYDPVL